MVPVSHLRPCSLPPRQIDHSGSGNKFPPAAFVSESPFAFRIPSISRKQDMKALLCIAAVAALLTGSAFAQTPPQTSTKKVDGTENVYVFRYGGHLRCSS